MMFEIIFVVLFFNGFIFFLMLGFEGFREGKISKEGSIFVFEFSEDGFWMMVGKSCIVFAKIDKEIYNFFCISVN